MNIFLQEYFKLDKLLLLVPICGSVYDGITSLLLKRKQNSGIISFCLRDKNLCLIFLAAD